VIKLASSPAVSFRLLRAGIYNIAGYTYIYGLPKTLYFAEMTRSFGFPGNERYQSIPVGDFVVSDVTDYAATRFDFVRKSIRSLANTPLSQHVSSISLSETKENFADICVLKQITARPSSAPSTSAHPSTALPTISPTELPTIAPSGQPTAHPQTAHPTNHPVTSKPTQEGDTIEPTADPSSPPSIVPTASPTPLPTAAPSSDPSAGPTVNPSTAAPTNAPSPPPSASPSAVPTDPPSEDPSVQPTSNPSASPSPEPTAALKQPPQSKPAALIFNWSEAELSVVGILIFSVFAGAGAIIRFCFCPKRNIERNRVLPVSVGDAGGGIAHGPRRRV
jgi:hypothetical protein